MESRKKEPILICIAALNMGTNKEVALKQAKRILPNLLNADRRIDGIDPDLYIMIANARSMGFAIIASVFVWNNCYESAYELEKEFLYDQLLWYDNERRALELYLANLIIQKQTEHLNEIFKNEDFRNQFLHFEDVYLSIINPQYHFKSESYEFVSLLHHINNYSKMMLTDNKFM